MILYQQDSLSSPHNQAEEVKAASCQHSGSQSGSPAVPVMQINNTQEKPSTSVNAKVKNKTAIPTSDRLSADESSASHQREALHFLVKVMLGQETLSFAEADSDSLPSSSFEKFYRCNMMNAALNTQTILFHLKALFAKLKGVELEQADNSEHRNLKKSIYSAIASFFKAGVEYQRVSRILLDEINTWPKNILKKQSFENPNRENNVEEYKLLETQKAVYDSRMQELHDKNIDDREIDKMLSDHLFSYRVIFPIKNIFPDLQSAEILEIIRAALHQTNTMASPTTSSSLFAQHNHDQSCILLTISNLEKSEILQKDRQTASEIFWDSFNTELSHKDLNVKFREFLFINWGFCSNFRSSLQADPRAGIKSDNLQERFKSLSQKLLLEKVQEISIDLIRHILHVKYHHDQSKTKRGGRDWLTWQMQIEIAHNKIQDSSLAKILDCYEAHKKRKERWFDPNVACTFTEAEIDELILAKRKIAKHTNQIIREISKAFSKHQRYISHVLYILKEQGSIDLKTILFLAENVKEDKDPQFNASAHISGIKRPYYPQQTNHQARAKRKKKRSEEKRNLSHLSEFSAIQPEESLTNQFFTTRRLGKTSISFNQENAPLLPISLTGKVQFSPTHSSSSTLGAFSPVQQEEETFFSQISQRNLPLEMRSEHIPQVSSQNVANEALALDINLDFDTDLNIDIGRYLDGDNFDLFEDLDQYS